MLTLPTGAVLAVISRSPTDVQPVFDAIVGTARRLCGAEHAILFKLEDGKYHVAANSGSEAEFIQFLEKNIQIRWIPCPNWRGCIGKRQSLTTRRQPPSLPSDSSNCWSPRGMTLEASPSRTLVSPPYPRSPVIQVIHRLG